MWDCYVDEARFSKRPQHRLVQFAKYVWDFSTPKTRGAFTDGRLLSKLHEIFSGKKHDDAFRVEPFWQLHEQSHLILSKDKNYSQQAEKAECHLEYPCSGSSWQRPVY